MRSMTGVSLASRLGKELLLPLTTEGLLENKNLGILLLAFCVQAALQLYDDGARVLRLDPSLWVVSMRTYGSLQVSFRCL